MYITLTVFSDKRNKIRNKIKRSVGKISVSQTNILVIKKNDSCLGTLKSNDSTVCQGHFRTLDTNVVWTRPCDAVQNPGVPTQTRQQSPAADIVCQQKAAGENDF